MSKSLRDRISRGLSSVLVLLSSGGTFQISNNNVVCAMDSSSSSSNEIYESALDEEGLAKLEEEQRKEKDIDKNKQFKNIKKYFAEDPFDEHEENIAKNKGEENRYDFDDLNLSKIEKNNDSYIYETDNELKSIMSFEDNQKENHNLTDYELKTKLKLEGNERHKESCIKEEENIISLNINKDINESENNDEKKEERSKEMVEERSEGEEDIGGSLERKKDSVESDDETVKEKNNSNPFIKNEKKKLPSKTFLEDEEYRGRSFIKEKNKFKRPLVKKLREEGYRSESEKRIGIKKQIKLDKVKKEKKDEKEGNAKKERSFMKAHSWNERATLGKQLETGYHSEHIELKLDPKKLTNEVKVEGKKEEKEKRDESKAKAELRIDEEEKKTDQDSNKSQYPIKEHPPAGGAEHNEWSTMKKCAVTASAILGLVVLGKGGYELYHYLSDDTETEYDDDDDLDWEVDEQSDFYQR